MNLSQAGNENYYTIRSCSGVVLRYGKAMSRPRSQIPRVRQQHITSQIENVSAHDSECTHHIEQGSAVGECPVKHSTQVISWMFKSGRGAARAEYAQGTPAQSHISPSILVCDDKLNNLQGGE